MKPITSFYLLALCCFLLPLSCKKEESGGVSGYVYARDNQTPVEGATVYLRSYTHAGKDNGNCSPDFNAPPSPNRQWTADSTLTDINGFFSFETPYPFNVSTGKKHYFSRYDYSVISSGLIEKSDNTVELQLEPYAWVKFRGYNVSGAYKLLIYGADDKGYELIIPQNESGEMIIPARNGTYSSNVYLFEPNNQIILPPAPDYILLNMRVECTYRDTTLFEMYY